MSDTKEQVTNHSFPAYGTKPTTMKFSFRSPTEAAVKAALEAGNPAPIKADPVEIQIMAMSAEDIVQLARDFLNSPESPEAIVKLTWLATLAMEDVKAAIKASFDDQPAHQQINLAAVDYSALTLFAIASAPRTSRTVPLTDAEWDTFIATMALFYKEELPTKSATQFGNMAKLLRNGWRVLAGQEYSVKQRSLENVIGLLEQFASWVPQAAEIGMQVKQGEEESAIDTDLVANVVGQCLAKAKKLAEQQVVALEF